MTTVNSSKQTSGWTSSQAYVMAVICLLIGITAGYFVRGSASATAAPATEASMTPAMAGPVNQPDPQQLKQMVDKEAEPLLKQLQSSPNDPSLLAQVGDLYYDAQQYPEAIGYYDRSLKVSPKNANVRTDMGTAYFYQGDSDRALSEFQVALKDDPKHAQTLFNMGMVKWRGKNDINGAIESWQKLLQVAPDYPDRAKVEDLIAKAKQHTSMAPGTKTTKPDSM